MEFLSLKGGCRCSSEPTLVKMSNCLKANTSDTEAAFLDLHLSISNENVSTKIYDKRDDFNFEIVNFLFLDGDVRSTSYGSISLNSFVLLTSTLAINC